MFFKNHEGIIGSQYPSNIKDYKEQNNPKIIDINKGITIFKPIIPISTYYLNKILYKITKDNIVTSTILK